jgi:integrase
LNVNNSVTRRIIPALKEAKLAWKGWHAFRRGLATNLHQLGVPDNVIQAILRHADVSTTMNVYVKSVPKAANEAMKALEDVFTKCSPSVHQKPVITPGSKAVN